MGLYIPVRNKWYTLVIGMDFMAVGWFKAVITEDVTVYIFFIIRAQVKIGYISKKFIKFVYVFKKDFYDEETYSNLYIKFPSSTPRKWLGWFSCNFICIIGKSENRFRVSIPLSDKSGTTPTFTFISGTFISGNFW